jgi:hypothetical protein
LTHVSSVLQCKKCYLALFITHDAEEKYAMKNLVLFFCVFFGACATTKEQPVAQAPPAKPQVVEQETPPIPSTDESWPVLPLEQRPNVDFEWRVPNRFWASKQNVPVVPTFPPMPLVLFSTDTRGMIFIALVHSHEGSVEEIAGRYQTRLVIQDVLTSTIQVSADGERAMFATEGASGAKLLGRVFVQRLHGRPDVTLVATGIWSPKRDQDMFAQMTYIMSTMCASPCESPRGPTLIVETQEGGGVPARSFLLPFQSWGNIEPRFLNGSH